MILAGQIPKTQLFAYTINSNLTMTYHFFGWKIGDRRNCSDLSPTWLLIHTLCPNSSVG